jgi:hypothetical protein
MGRGSALFVRAVAGGAGGTVGAANVAKRAPDGCNGLFGAVHHTQVDR